MLRHCYSRRERPRISLHSLEQPVEHSLHIQYVGHHGVVLLRGDEAEIPRQKKLIFDFTRGSERNLHKPRKLALSTTATLSQICRNRSRSAPELNAKPKDFRAREMFRHPIYIKSKVMRLFPNFKIAEVLHGVLS